jgi:hypothetical protein
MGDETGMSATEATYVYCIVQAAAPPGLAGAPAGLPATGAPRLLPLGGDLWAVAAAAPLPEYGGDAIDAHLADLDWVGDRALAHERVVEHFAAVHPVLPMKLFTLFSGDARAAERLAAERPEMERVFARIAGREEWGVRVLFQEARARQALNAGEGAEGAGAAAAATSGKSFLLRKKQEQESVRTLAARVRGEVERAYADLARHAAAARRHQPVPGEGAARLLLDAAFLVPKGDGQPFEEAVRRWADLLATHACELTLTGPWPPYNFIAEPS